MAMFWKIGREGDVLVSRMTTISPPEKRTDYDIAGLTLCRKGLRVDMNHRVPVANQLILDKQTI